MNHLYGTPISPFVRKVAMLLDHKQQQYNLAMGMLNDMPEEVQAANPLQKIPVFRDDNIIVPDSSVICDYLEQKYPEKPLYPSDPVARAKALWFEEFGDTRLLDLMGPGYFLEKKLARVFFQREPDEQKMQSSLDAMPQYLDYLEREIEPGATYLVEGQLSIADISVGNMFMQGFLAGYQVDANNWPNTAGYLERLLALPLFKEWRLKAEQAMAAMGVS